MVLATHWQDYLGQPMTMSSAWFAMWMRQFHDVLIVLHDPSGVTRPSWGRSTSAVVTAFTEPRRRVPAIR